MGFVPRKNKNINTDLDVNVVNYLEQNKKVEISSFDETETNWKQQAIKVLNILEKDGINIYDENRTPGMYLKNNNNKNISPKIINILGENTQTNKETDSNISKNLFEFLTKK